MPQFTQYFFECISCGRKQYFFLLILYDMCCLLYNFAQGDELEACRNFCFTVQLTE